ncbi:hypothetical protein G6F56_002350 [Rhizopus delemar]|nr:hypothetical protein G6F56_002350 [Rhizopus delemar]
MKPRPEGRLTRQDTAQYSYVSKPNNFDHPNIHVHHACISCLSHFADLKYLKHHINDVHQSQHPADNAVPAEEEPQAKRQRLIQQTPAVANSKNTVFTFPSAMQPSQALELPRIDQTAIDALEHVISIIVPYNSSLSDAQLTQLGKNADGHATLSTLKMFPVAYNLLMNSLDQPLENLPSWLWAYSIEETTPAMERQLVQTFRFILTDFVSTATIRTIPSSMTDERTFLINHVVPIFKSFGSQTNMLCFNWCESQLRLQTKQARIMVNIGHLDEVKLRFVDGLGFDFNGSERLIMEISGGQASDDHQHVCDDTLKVVHSLMCILKNDAQTSSNASFATYQQVKAFGIQTAKTTMILSEMRLNNLKYEYTEIMSVIIPTNDSNRSKWLPVGNLLAYLMVQLDKQMAILKKLQEEHDGKVQVHPDSTIRRTLFNNELV